MFGLEIAWNRFKCQSQGLMHRDIKPENFRFKDSTATTLQDSYDSCGWYLDGTCSGAQWSKVEGPFLHRLHSREPIIRQLLDFGGAKVADETPKVQPYQQQVVPSSPDLDGFIMVSSWFHRFSPGAGAQCHRNFTLCRTRGRVCCTMLYHCTRHQSF